MKEDTIFLEHIIEAIQSIQDYTSSLTKDDFLQNKLVKDATIRNFEIIGEATKNISTKLKEKYKIIEWKNMAGMRDKLIHGYFGVDYFIIWETIIHILPKLKNDINYILEQES